MPTTGLMVIAVLLLAGLAAWHDWRSLRIPNWISLTIIALFPIAVAMAPNDFFPLWPYPAAGLGMLAITFALFAMGRFGGGDAKLASALALWLGLKGLVPFIMFMAIAGGVLGLVGLYIKKTPARGGGNSDGWIAQLRNGRNALPYGIAIALGMLGAVFHTVPYSQNLDELVFLIH